MDVAITTTHPSEVNPAEVAKVLEEGGFYVHKVEVFDRANILHATWTEGGR